MEHKAHESFGRKKEAGFLGLFVALTKAVTSSLDLDEVFTLITQKIPQILNVDASTVRLLDGSGKRLVLSAASGLSEAYLNRGPIDTEEPIFKALKGEPIFIEDAAKDSRINYPEATEQKNIKTILVGKPAYGKDIGGVLRLLSRTSRSYS